LLRRDKAEDLLWFRKSFSLHAQQLRNVTDIRILGCYVIMHHSRDRT